eukprot:EG_transcript_31797
MAPTAFHPSAAAQQPQQQQADGEAGERQGQPRFPGRFANKDANHAGRAPTDADSEDQKRRYVPRHAQAARYNGPAAQQPSEEGATHPNPGQGHHHPHQHQHHHPPQGQRRPNFQKEVSGEGKSFSRPAPPNPSIHKLGRSYTFSAYKRPATHLQETTESYEKSIKVIGRFDTVEGFWAFYSHMQRPGDLSGMNADYHLFAEGIAPA